MMLLPFWKARCTAAASISLATSMDARLLSGGTRWKEIPSGGVNPVAPPWLNSSVRSMNQWDVVLRHAEVVLQDAAGPQGRGLLVLAHADTLARDLFRAG